jgi:hypothetical protein
MQSFRPYTGKAAPPSCWSRSHPRANVCSFFGKVSNVSAFACTSGARFAEDDGERFVRRQAAQFFARESEHLGGFCEASEGG